MVFWYVGTKTFAPSKIVRMFGPKMANIAPNYAFWGTWRPCWLLVVVGCGARAALSIECLPTLQYLIPCNKSSFAFRTNLMISSLATNLLLNFLECRHRLPRTVQNGQDSNLCRGGGNILKYCNLLKSSPLHLQFNPSLWNILKYCNLLKPSPLHL